MTDTKNEAATGKSSAANKKAFDPSGLSKEEQELVVEVLPGH